MERRILGRAGLQVGVIGLGTEHLLRETASMEAVLDMAVGEGVSYVDLLYADPAGADKEFWEAFGPPLRAQREGLVLAAHWGSGLRDDLPYFQRCFDDLLEELGNGYAEIGLMTMVDSESKWTGWTQASLGQLYRHKAKGRVGHIGLSSHVEAVALEAVESDAIDVLMFPINLLSHDNADAQALIEACVDHAVGLVAMKAYHGGTFFRVNGQPLGITPLPCLAYVLSLPVATAVPGPKTPEELQATLHHLHATDAEREILRS